jgi:chemosensory pili system protein ChpA (sensor histidine kinase/response regulator)
MNQSILGTEVNAFAIDRSPLAWILEDLKKSLKFATAVVRRFAWEVKNSSENDAVEMDASPLSQVQRQLQQGAAALDMVGQQVPAVMLRAVESLSRKFIQSPKSCTDDAAHCVDRSCLAVIDYLEGFLKGPGGVNYKAQAEARV